MTKSDRQHRRSGEAGPGPAKPRRVTLGVSAGIAIYKSCDLVRRLMERGCEVRVVMTDHATRMVAPVTFQALSGNPVITDLFAGSGDPSIAHVELAKWEEVLAVAPATANVLAKFARGIADDFLSTHYLASTAPVLLAPAMNGNMWRHGAVRENMELLQRRGHRILMPAKGLLACGDVDEGKLPEPAAIAGEVLALLTRPDLDGLDVLVTAGPTREALDPVRFLSNRSSGKMGYAVAAEAARRGARVTLITGPVALQAPAGVDLVNVTTAAEMESAVRLRFPSSKILVMAAAVADYRASEILPQKRKKRGDLWTVELRKTPDILGGLKDLRKRGQMVVGFAAESEALFSNARRKLEGKNLDLICANDISKEGLGFDSDQNALTLLWADGRREDLGADGKERLARAVWDRLAPRLKTK